MAYNPDSVLDSANKFLSVSVFGSVYADDDRVVRVYKRVQNEAAATRRVLFLSFVAWTHERAVSANRRPALLYAIFLSKHEEKFIYKA